MVLLRDGRKWQIPGLKFAESREGLLMDIKLSSKLGESQWRNRRRPDKNQTDWDEDNDT